MEFLLACSSSSSSSRLGANLTGEGVVVVLVVVVLTSLLIIFFMKGDVMISRHHHFSRMGHHLQKITKGLHLDTHDDTMMMDKERVKMGLYGFYHYYNDENYYYYYYYYYSPVTWCRYLRSPLHGLVHHHEVNYLQS